MPQSEIHITASITAHREGIMAGLTLRSFLDCIAHAEAEGLVVEKIIVLDRANATTRAVFSDVRDYGAKVIETDFGDQGQARNAAVALAGGAYIAFLDADDLWSYNWLTEAHRLCATDPGRIIAHPEFDWFFHGNNNVYIKMDQCEPRYTNEFLRFANYWDALCLAPRNAHTDYPFCERDIQGGFAFEDWHWNCRTVEAGYVHRVANGTIHFKRRREGSQTLEASKRKSLTKPTKLHDYAWVAATE
jgi:glycosyltransferase involved in cell wall biosynthesis